MKKILIIIFIMINIYFTDSYAVSSRSAVLIDSHSGRILYEENAYEKLPMASTTKIMTGLLACESGKLDKVVKASPFASGTEGSSLWLKIGEEQTLENLTYGLMLKSGNDAAVAIAEYLGGNIDAFALMMNKRAKESGATNTNFENPHGLDSEGHYTTAYDLALIAREAMKNNHFRKIVSTKTYSIPMQGEKWGRALKNHNKLLWRYDGCIGVKTGFTKKSGRCLVSCAEKEGEEYICVTLNFPDDWNKHTILLDSAFEEYDAKYILRKGQEGGCVSLKDKNKTKVFVMYEKDFKLAVKESDKITIEKKYKKLKLPLKKGSIAGVAEIICNGEKMGKVNLITEKDIRKPGILNEIITCFIRFFDKRTI